MQKTIFHIDKMDCPAEENLIKMKLEGINAVHHLDFNLQERELTVFHEGRIGEIEHAINTLRLGEKKLYTEDVEQKNFEVNANQKRILWIVLVINMLFFFGEIITGFISKSMGLVADSLDMLADGIVYGLSLFAVGGTVNKKKDIAKIAGYFQLVLAVFGFLEVIRRFFYAEEIPDFSMMIIVSFFALLANAMCIYLLQGAKNKEDAHIQASLIFTSNDVLINLGVILAAILVHYYNSKLPDLIIGIIVFAMVIEGALRILKLSKP